MSFAIIRIFLICFLIFTASCSRNSLLDINRSFSKKYDKQIKNSLNKFKKTHKKPVVYSNYKRHQDILGISSIFNFENSQITNFSNRKIYQEKPITSGNQIPIENFITVDEDVFKPKYITSEKKPYKSEEVIFDNIKIPNNDIFGISENLHYKRYHIPNKRILQQVVDRILDKFDDEHRAILLRVMKDKEIMMERMSKNN